MSVSRSGHYVLSHGAAKFPVAVKLTVEITPIVVDAPLNPARGPTAGGTVVTFAGSGFTGAAGVEFGGVASPQVNVAAGGAQLTATTPAHAAGAVEVKITAPAGIFTLAMGFTFV